MKNVDRDVYYGIMPLLKHERIYSYWDIVLATGAWAIATWCYVQGGTIASLLGFKEAITGTMFGMVLAGIIIYLCVIIPTRNGIDIWLYLRALLGHLGVSIFAIIYIAGQFGYYSINAEIYANSVMRLSDAAGFSISSVWKPLIAITCIIFGTMIALRGPIAVRTSTRIMVPSLLLVGVIILISVFSQFSIADLAAITPPDEGAYGDRHTSYMLVMEWNIAYILAWFGALGVFARLVKTERSSYWGHMTGFSVIMAGFICIGVITTLAMYASTGVVTDDPTEWLIELGGPGFGLISLIFIVIANVTTQAVGLYSFAVSSKVIMPKLKFKTVTYFWAGWVTLLILWGGIWTYYETFLAVIGATAGSVVALVIADFYIVRKQRFSMRGLYKVNGDQTYTYTGGFNIPAWVSFFVGIICYFLVYDPINAVPRSDIFLYTTATGLTMFVSAALYIILSKFTRIKNYLIKTEKTNK
ncbi:cytosine permease [Oceanobacillus sp. FSL W7-1293]|uniref:purine-cytosine permease family protein n=1 Tax=Oceanobacillus sp. FSL W7-1293 TaxID=2921699 RepID=UPI0030D495D6